MQGIKYRTEAVEKEDGTKLLALNDVGGENFTSKIYQIKGDTAWGIQIIAETYTGTFTIYHSIDGENFVPYSSDTISLDMTDPVSSIQVDNHCIAPYIQFEFDVSGETGKLTAFFMRKEIL